jgi:xanthine/CO dehydrogenase XdhC/CoxF family maturation factor
MAEGNVMESGVMGSGAMDSATAGISNDDDVLSEAALWREQGRDVALATVVRTWGSSPRPIGSHLAIDGDSNFVGSVSGGCIEGAVIHEALEVMKDGKPRVLEYGVTNEMAWEVGLACGGQVHVFVEKVD